MNRHASESIGQPAPLKSYHIRSMQLAIFAVGLTAMVVAGWYLIEGMLHFSGDAASKRVFIAAGIIFQITESICFISAAALSSRHLYWRVILFAMGCVLFFFSITVMTLAQKATLQSGENETIALNDKIEATRAQIGSLNDTIAAYRLNAKKQSQSIYANSRELGQDSLNRATELEQQKKALSDKLFQLQSSRRQTSSDFFQQLETVTGLPASQTEFYFLVSRSLLLELCGILLLSFAAHLKAPKNTLKHGPALAIERQRDTIDRPKAVFTRNKQREITPSLVNSGHWASSHIQVLKQKSRTSDPQ
ncbi:MAG: hypothetical protein PVJ39_01770 [Gammaproteobacteria bacterium]|jgi:hypothetical protein